MINTANRLIHEYWLIIYCDHRFGHTFILTLMSRNVSKIKDLFREIREACAITALHLDLQLPIQQKTRKYCSKWTCISYL